MRTIQKLALSALLILSPAALEASPYRSDYRSGPDHRSGYGNDYGRDYGRSASHGPSRGYTPPRHSHFSSRVEVQAQIRLRQLGYYRGPIDGMIGRGSRHSIIRFQRDYRLPPSGYLDHRTLRALGIVRR